jgi:hypothetical protein
MLAAVLRALLSPILGTVEKIYDRKLTAETESKKLAADLAVKQMEGDQAARLNAKEIRLATAGFWEMRLLTFVIAAPLALHQALVVYDTMNTSVNLAIPALPAPFNKYQGTILLSFFGLQIGNKVFDTAAYIFGRRR